MSGFFSYDSIGKSYSRTRREDPFIRDHIFAALGNARVVANVGAGTGSYEPRDRYVIAIEPSDVMASQRPDGLVPAIRAAAESIPLRDNSVDIAMAILSIHHWDDCRKGISEMLRIARDRVIVLTYDTSVSNNMWLMTDYAPEIAQLDSRTFPSMTQLQEWLGGEMKTQAIPIRRDCLDWMVGSFWAHPERVLDPIARAGTSALSRLAPEVIERIEARLSHDLKNGEWDKRNGHLRTLQEFDAGLRLVQARV